MSTKSLNLFIILSILIFSINAICSIAVNKYGNE